MSTDHTAERRTAQGGPPLGVLAVVSTVLFLAGAFGGTAIAGTSFPSPFGPDADVLAHVRDNTTALQVSGLLQFASAIPFVVFAAAAAARLHHLGVRAAGATIALAGGVLGGGFLALSGLLQWSLSRSATVAAEPVVRALHDLTFLTGGPGSVTGLGLLIAGIAVPGWLAGLLPRWLAVVGIALAVIAELSTLVLLTPAAGVLLPLARFPGLIWIIAAGFLLPRHRARRTAADAGSLASNPA